MEGFKLDDNIKKLLIIFGCVLGVFILVFVVIAIINSTKPTYYSYDTVVSGISKASEQYVKANPNKFTTDNTKYNLQYSTLVNEGYIKPLDQLLKDGSKCNANIVITKKDGIFSYVPYLNCGDDYVTKELYKQVLEDNPVVSEGSGLWKASDGTYYFRGNKLNNFVKFGSYNQYSVDYNYIWQIMSIDNDNNIRMILYSNLADNYYIFDNRYNIDENNTYGYNTFDDSELSYVLRDWHKDRFTDSEKNLLKEDYICVGTREDDDDSIDGKSECSELSKDKYYVRLLTPYEYIRTSLDENCNYINDKSCINYNWLYTEGSAGGSWTTTKVPNSTSLVYRFSGYNFESQYAKYQGTVAAIIEVNGYAFFKSGTGTEEDPYVIK